MKYATQALLIVLATMPPVAMAADAPGTRVLTPPPQAKPAPEPAFDQRGFQQQYAQHGKPAIAIFWNRQVSDALSQWQATSRNVVERRLSGRSADPAAAGSNDYDCSFALPSTEAGDCEYKQLEFTERNIGTDAGRNDVAFTTRRDEFAFSSALTQALLGSGVAIVDRDLVMRLTQARQQNEPLAPASADYYEVELQALTGYAEYVAEVLLAETGVATEELSFMVNIKEIATGRLVGMFSAQGARQTETTMRWTTGPNGYERVQDEIRTAATPAEIGRDVGEQTMEALAAYWSTNP
jgi:hypothetical protein